MQLDRVAIALRPRQGWEAVDLGFRMAAHWARPVWTVCIVIVWPLALALSFALAAEPWVAALIIWWLKPVYDRFLLHVLSRAVFGAPPGLAQTLGAWRDILQPALLGSLLTRFFDFSRSFSLPVLQLERQTGKPARARRKLLKQRAGAHASGLTLICINLEAIIFSGLIVSASLLVPDAQLSADTGGSSAELWEIDQWWTWSDTLVYVLALTLIEPFYVAAGFALYLNRRVMLEGWDVELALRGMAQRAQAAAARTGGIAALVLALGFGLSALAPWSGTYADDGTGKTVVEAEESASDEATDEEDEAEGPAYVPRDTEARQAIVKVLSEPTFGSERQVQRWRSIEEEKPKDTIDLQPRSWWGDLIEVMAELMRILAWIGVAVLIIAVALAVMRQLPSRRPRLAPEAAPSVLFGLSIAPESLPPDIPGAARAALAAGEIREALSLLYRGALSHLVHVRGLRVGKGATEGDVLRLAHAAWVDGPTAFFDTLMPAWVEAAYAARLPTAASVAALCDAYADALMPQAAAPVAR